MTGRAANGPSAPRPSTALPSVAIATEVPLAVRPRHRTAAGQWRWPLAHARRVGQGQVLAGADGDPGRYFDLAAQVVEERAVRDVPDPAIACSSAAVTAATCSSLAAWRVRSTVVPVGRHLDQVHPDDHGPGRADGLAQARQQGGCGGRESPVQ